MRLKREGKDATRLGELEQGGEVLRGGRGGEGGRSGRDEAREEVRVDEVSRGDEAVGGVDCADYGAGDGGEGVFEED